MCFSEKYNTNDNMLCLLCWLWIFCKQTRTISSDPHPGHVTSTSDSRWLNSHSMQNNSGVTNDLHGCLCHCLLELSKSEPSRRAFFPRKPAVQIPLPNHSVNFKCKGGKKTFRLKLQDKRCFWRCFWCFLTLCPNSPGSPGNPCTPGGPWGTDVKILASLHLLHPKH